MLITKVVPANSKVADKTVREELNKIYNQFTSLIDIINKQQETIAQLEAKQNG